MKRPLRDPRLKFFPKSHKYKLGRKELTSVTTWLKQFFGDFDEKEQAKRSNRNPNSKYYKLGVRKIKALWKAASQHGTDVHEQIEFFLLGKSVPTEPKALQAVEVIDDLFTRLQIQPSNSFPELRIYSEELGLAGTIDWLILTEGGVLIYDWKTNGSLQYSLKKYQAQLNVYSYILEKEYGIQVLGMRIVHLGEDSSEVIVVERDYEMVEKFIEESK